MTAIPGPDGDQFAAFEADPYGFLRDLQPYGTVVGVDLGGINTAVLFDLDDIHRVFADKLDVVGRASVFERLSHVMGSGILTNYDWETWQPRRRLIVKPLGARRIGQFHDRMVSIIDAELETWPVGIEFDLYEQVRLLTLRVVADLLFSHDLSTEGIEIIERAVDEIHAWAEADPANADTSTEPDSFRLAIDELDWFIRCVIDSRDRDDPGDDMVGILLRASSDQSEVIDHVGVRDEAVTLLLAGHDTVTSAVSFSLDLVARNPGAATADPRAIVDEALRLYPPVHMTTRLLLDDVLFGEVSVPKGWEVLVPEYVLYRDGRYFEEPDAFRPDRWDEDSDLHMNRRAYFPFLTGPKFCAGSHFALMEATEVVGRALRRFTVSMSDPAPPRCRHFAATFSPDGPMMATVERR